MTPAAPRFVSLCPSLTETLFDLGVGPSVVGATKFCVHPAAGMEHVARVGGTKDPRLERIDDLAPTLVFANEEENRKEDIEELRGSGWPVHTSFPRRVDDVPGMIRSVGAAVGRVERAEVLASAVEEAAATARGRTGVLPRPSFLVLVWRGPWMGASGDTYLSDLLETAGGRNVLAGDESRYPELSADRIRALGPDRVLLPSEPYPFRRAHAQELASATGVDFERIRECDGEWLTWHGPRTARALREAARWLTAG